MERSRLPQDGTVEPVSRDQILGANPDKEIFISLVELTTCRIGNLTRLIDTLPIRATIHTYFVTTLFPHPSPSNPPVLLLSVIALSRILHTRSCLACVTCFETTKMTNLFARVSRRVLMSCVSRFLLVTAVARLVTQCLSAMILWI